MKTVWMYMVLLAFAVVFSATAGFAKEASDPATPKTAPAAPAVAKPAWASESGNEGVPSAPGFIVPRDGQPNPKMALPDDAVILYQAKQSGMPLDLCRLHTGELLSAFRQSKHHTDIWAQMASVRSNDGGKTRGEHTIIKKSENPAIDYRDPSITELSDGTLICTFFSFRGTTHRPNWVGGFVVVMRSVDGGRTWPEEYKLPTDPFDFMCITERCIELPTGRVLMPVHGGSRARAFYSGAMWCSDDKGKTWRYLSTATKLPWHGKSFWSMETALVRAQSGKLVAISRSNKHMLQATSSDGGETWAGQEELPWTPPETQPSLNCLHDGTLLLMYGDRGPHPRSPTYPYAIKAHLSTDEGRTWGKPIMICSGLPHWDMGYPTSVELAPGQILTAFWIGTPVNPEKLKTWPNNMSYATVCRRWEVGSAQGHKEAKSSEPYGAGEDVKSKPKGAKK